MTLRTRAEIKGLRKEISKQAKLEEDLLKINPSLFKKLAVKVKKYTPKK